MSPLQLASFLLFLAGVVAVTNRREITAGVKRIASRGVRNNNPGNLRRTSIAWQGEVPDALKTDAEFEQFISPVYGIRAMARDLLTGAKRGENTVEKIITAWAPPSENNTAAYIADVARRLGVNSDTVLHVPSMLAELVAAIIEHENGAQPYPAALIHEGVALA